MKNILAYYRLAKPGIVYSNVLSAVAGFLMVSKSGLDFGLLLAVISGVTLVIASACVFNNYLDRSIDSKMERTKRRALVTGKISNRNAIIFGSNLGIIGFLVLGFFTNGLTLLVGIVGYIDYIIFYGLAKRYSNYSTIIGSVSGSASLVAGYVAVTDSFDSTAWALFFIMVFWQMAHFHAIALRRVNDYREAGINVLPIVKGEDSTKFAIKMYVAGFALCATSLFILGSVGYVYLLTMLVLSWLWITKSQTEYTNNTEWAKEMFAFSLKVLLIFCLLLSLNTILP